MHFNLLTLAAAAVVIGAGGETQHGSSAVAGPVSAAAAASSNTVAVAVEAAGRRSASRAEVAVDALARHVRVQSHPEALRLAFRAYYNYRAAHPEQVRKPYLYFVDYGLDNHTPRGYVFDMESLRLVEGPFNVAHGRGSLRARNGVPTRFTNIRNSATTSLGLYLTQETYAFRGKSGGSRYRSIGLRLRGLSGRYNSAARERGVVMHGAPYVTPSGAGRSEGCPAVEEDRAQRLIPELAGGSLVFLFSPLDREWMRNDPWLGGPLPSVATIGE